ncbi:hypothetical protein KI387_028867 [Taxus chinensis]|uniref:Uncharacterized protein n=1 Tax=Taxus chinensis TaxID=29808 RepID=A0AA38CC39_TAXCH|nr:hypothetical protein KI387_028867 [Taxus chinensis]
MTHSCFSSHRQNKFTFTTNVPRLSYALKLDVNFRTIEVGICIYIALLISSAEFHFLHIHKMARNLGESPLIAMAAPEALGYASPFALRRFLGNLFCCRNAVDESPSWSEKLKESARWGGECSASLIANEIAASWGRKWRNFFRKLKRSNSMSTTALQLGVCNGYDGNEMSKSGRFQYDPLSYALNFDDGTVDEDEHSLRAFSARFACPIAKPRETECPFI